MEDNPADVYLFRKALEEAELKFELMVIRSSEAALALVRGDGEYAACSVPDLAVLDVNLPKNDGIEVLEVIRATPRYARVPVVVTSSSPALPHRSNLDQLRIARYITKPADLQDFLSIGATLKEVLLESTLKRAAGHG